MNHHTNYAKFVASRMKTMDTPLLDIVHMAMGIAGESGELVDAVKKRFAYNKPLDLDNVMEELGDILFYVQGMLLAIGNGYTLSALMELNTEKLTRRYPSGYSDADAIARADKESTDDAC